MQPSDHALKLLHELAHSAQPVHLVFLLENISAHLEAIRLAALKNELLPVDIAQLIAERLRVLLQDLDGLAAEQQQLVIGAARYFISTDDELPDTESVLGLDDDAAIFNHVAALVGRKDLTIQL